MKLFRLLKNFNYAIFCGTLLSIIIAGCASWFMNGGLIVDEDFVPDVLVSYRAEGIVPVGVDYLLIRTATGESIFERSSDGSGVLFQTHWEDNDGDHFAGWVSGRTGYEFVIQKDRTLSAKKYVYPTGYYSITEINGVLRPVPVVEIEPVATLIPK